MRWVALTLFCGLAILPAVAETAADTCLLDPGPPVAVSKVLDSETLVLGDGRTVRLIGALGPKAPLWWPREKEWYAETRAKRALERLVAGRKVGLGISGREADRHGRVLAQVFVADDPERLWVQGRMVETGHARAYSLPGSRACARALQSREARARRARAGIWGGTFFAPVTSDKTDILLKRRYSFQIVEGRVASVAERRSWTFINFGSDYKSDFTIAVRSSDRKRFKGADIVLQALAGKQVRVRGWIERWNGPAIKVTHPEQIELIGEDTAGGVLQKKNPAPEGPAPGSVDL